MPFQRVFIAWTAPMCLGLQRQAKLSSQDVRPSALRAASGADGGSYRRARKFGRCEAAERVRREEVAQQRTQYSQRFSMDRS